MSEETTNSGNVEAPAEAESPEIAEVEQPQSGAPFPQDDYDKRVEALLKHHEKKKKQKQEQWDKSAQQQDLDYAQMKLEEGESWDNIYNSVPENVQRAMGSLRGDYTRKMQELSKQRKEIQELQANLTNSDAFRALQETATKAAAEGQQFDPFDNASMETYINGLVAQKLQSILQPLAQEQAKQASMRRLNDFMDEHPELRTDETLRAEVAGLLQQNESMTLQQGYWIVQGKKSKEQQKLSEQQQQKKKEINKQVAGRIGSGRKSGMTAPPDAQKMSAADIYNYLLAQKK